MAPINVELLDLRAQSAVSEMRSVHRAADQLARSQPALSRRIQKPEQAVDAPLERSSRSVRLTQPGQQVLHRMMEEVDGSLIGSMASGERTTGQIIVAGVPSAAVRFMPDLLKRFGEEYHHVRILDLSTTDCTEAVRTGHAEFGLSLPIFTAGRR